MSGKVERICEYCAKEFYTYTSEIDKGGGKFCSSVCFHASRRIRIKQVCQYCQNQFEVIPSTISRGKGKYCSQYCREQGMTSICTCEKCGKKFKSPHCYTAVGRGKFCSVRCAFESKSKQVEVFCQECGKGFKVQLSRIKIGEGKFCSKKCASKSMSRPVETICQICGKVFNSVISERRKFCSQQCRGEWYGKTFYGENHPKWRGGFPESYGPNWNEQRRKALKRDSYTCLACGKKKSVFSNNPDVHHIIPFRTFGYVHGQNDNYKAANELTNLITLCRKCHMDAESGKIIIQPTHISPRFPTPYTLPTN